MPSPDVAPSHPTAAQPAAAKRRWRVRAGALAWAAVVFGLLNATGTHEMRRTMDERVERGELRMEPLQLLAAVRAYLNSDGDVRRYFAYANAALGRTYDAFYVRPMESWRRSFRTGDSLEERSEPTTPSRPLVPYRDFLVEYPPGFFLLALPLAPLTADPDVYVLLFGLLMALCLTAALLLCARLARRLPGPPIDAGRLAAWGALAAAALGVVVTQRYDASISLLLAAAFVGAAEGRAVLLGVALGLAVATKLLPLLAAPPLAMLLARRRQWRDLGVASATAAATALALAIPAAAAAGPALADLARYHGERPLQIESTASALLGLFRLVEPGSLRVEKTYGSFNVVGTYTGAGLAIAGALSLLGVIAAWALTWIRIRRAADDATALRAALGGAIASLAAFMVLGKLFSPQYLVWFVPLGVLASLQRGGARVMSLFIAVMLLTQVAYPATYGMLSRLHPIALGVVLTRNLLLLIWAAHPLFARDGQGDSRRTAAA